MGLRVDGRDLRRYSLLREIDGIKWNEIEEFSGTIGQARAESSVKFGLLMKKEGYNIYAIGERNTGKTSMVKYHAEKVAENEPVPPDICYVYNFKNPKEPIVLEFTAGNGKLFRNDVEEFIANITVDLQRKFNSKEYEDEKSLITKKYQEYRDDLIKVISSEAKNENFGVKSTNSGIYFMPIIDGEIISEEQYDDLSVEEKDEITKSSSGIQAKAVETMRKLKEYENQSNKEINELNYSAGLFEVGRHILHLFEMYGNSDKVTSYLLELKEDVLENIDLFIEEAEENDGLSALMPWYGKKEYTDEMEKYKVNLLLDNSELTSAPVIIANNPTYANLIGEVEYDNDNGNLSTDFMKIKKGLLHKANGGYLIVKAQDLLSNYSSFEVLRMVLKTGEIEIEPLREFSTGLALSGIKPEPSKVKVKVILVGDEYYYDLLNYYDDEFKKLFKICAEFDYEMPKNEKNTSEFLGFIKKIVVGEGLEGCSNDAIKKIIHLSYRLAERQDKITTQLGIIKDIIVEAVNWARIKNPKVAELNEEDISKAIKEREYRFNMYEEKVNEMIDENVIIIQTEGAEIGRINGLAVYDFEDYAFAKPSLITATSYMGKSGIVNIEKEAEMSGRIHDKGVQVLIGYLGNTYAQDFPISLSCRICFEQNYSGIDGDSASSTELYVILSSIAEVPINQEIAVTGSMNQFGDVQAIGGVTYKVEGFYDTCKKRGLTGTQGVIIPKSNLTDLVLKEEVIESIERGEFHIYAITNVEEAFEILMGLPPGTKNEKGKYNSNSIHGKVMKKLKFYHKKLM